MIMITVALYNNAG